ncbi:MAG: class I SAM-dependent methyltransferase [Oscillatoriales cyanobacterium RM2_1_1]|nr:class I SAM-dependent methyltransferase [Oscillatoriales cyanobacterium RM2_1_1]
MTKSMTRTDEVWKTATLSKNFLEGVRGAIPLAAEQLDILIRILQLSGSPLKTILDLGCGDGILGLTILKQYPTARVTFLDFSETMIAAAQQNIQPDFPDAEFLIKDFGTPDWLQSVQPIAPFDAIVSGFSIHHQTDQRKQELYGEIYQLLAPGGVFLNLEHVASASQLGENLFDQLFVDSLHGYHQNLGSHQSRAEIDRQYYSRADKTANILAAVELQCDWLRTLGFTDVDCFMKLFEIALFGGIKPD